MRFVFLVMLMLAFISTPARAQDAECTLTPLTLERFDAFIAEPDSSAAAFRHLPPSLSLENAREIVENYVACTNTGDPAMIWAMFTPHWFAKQFEDPEVHYLPEFRYRLTMPPELVTNRLELISVQRVLNYQDGRIQVEVLLQSGDTEWADTLILAYQGDEWLIDETHTGWQIP